MRCFASPVRRRRVFQLTASLPLFTADDGWAATDGSASPKITKITGSIR